LTPVTINTNLQDPSALYQTKGFHTSLGFVSPKALKTSMAENFKAGSEGTEYKRVMERRKSRQSNFTHNVVDIEYAGDSAKFNHMINYRIPNGLPNQSNLNFGMKLRTYKNMTDFDAP